MNPSVISALDAFPGLRVLVVGEAMLDSYLHGHTGRLCREAPVPVVNLARRTDVPGGAANTAVNAACLGATVDFLSVVGDDAEGDFLRRALEAASVSADQILVEPGRRTLAKHRVLSDGQMLVRFDQGDTGPVAPAVRDELVVRLRQLFHLADAVIVSDYAYGVLGPAVIAELAALQAARPCVVLVDARHPQAYRGVAPTVVKPNYEEAAALLGLPEDGGRVDQLLGHGDRVLELTGARIAAVTLDRDGAVIFERGREPLRAGARTVRHAHVAGAGDTFAAALALALAAGAETAIAAELASAAASVVVEKDGTATCSDFELCELLCADRKVVTDREAAVARVEALRAQGRHIVFTNGCFDILHSGHITYLNQARRPGDVLVVGLNADESVRRLKGPERPINALDDRARVLAALSSVDLVVPFAEDTPADLIRAIRPGRYVKGGDYTEETLPEAPLVRALGGDVEILPFVEDHSTTGIIARIREATARRQRRTRRERRSPGAAPSLGGS